MAAPPPGADVQDGTGPPPQGLPSSEGSLRAPFPASLGGSLPCESGNARAPYDGMAAFDDTGLGSERSENREGLADPAWTA
jgi:hypothetical protein